MAYTCKVPSCGQRGSSGMFTCPSKAPAKWKLAMKVPDSQVISPSWRICYKHFPSENIDAKLKVEYSLKNKAGRFAFGNQTV